MILLFTVTVLFTIILIYLNFFNNQENYENAQPKCEFIPWGPSKVACNNRCRVDRDLWGGNACSQAKCYDICDSCVNNDNCKWLDSVDYLSEQKKINLQNQPANDVKIEIRGIEASNKSIIQWLHNSQVDYYLLKYFESANPNGGVKIFKIKEPKEGINTIDITNLKNSTSYSYILVPVIGNKQLDPSNKIDLTPNASVNINY
jgi:hypothetical protein